MWTTPNWASSCFALILAAIPASAADGRIAMAVVGSDSTQSFQIVGPSNVFQPDSPKIVCVWKAEGVKPGSHVRAVWIAEETGGAAPPDYKIDEASVVAETSQAQFNNGGQFTATRPTKGWPLGRYRVEIYLESALSATVRFTVAASHAPAAPAPVTPAPRILAAELGTDRTPDLHLLNAGALFPQSTAHIVCVWKSEGVRRGTAVRGVLLADDTGAVIGEVSDVTGESWDGGEHSGVITFDRPARGWPAGGFRFQIYLGKELAKTIPFTIRAEAAPPAHAPRITEAVLGMGTTEDSRIVSLTSEFPIDVPRVVCVWKSEGLLPGTVVRDVWIAEDTGPSHPLNHKLGEGPGAHTTHGAFTLTPRQGLRPGRYRLEIYLGDELAFTVPFTVKRPD